MQSAVLNKPHKKNGVLLKGALLSTSTLTVMAGATIAPSLPAMREIFSNVPNVDFLVGQVLTLPALFIAICSPLTGFLIDRFGRRTLMLVAIVLYGLSGGAGVVVPSLLLLLLARAFLGISVAGIRTCGNTLIADYFEGEERTQMFGLQAAFAGLGGTVFLALGGYLADVHWRGPFFIYLLAFVIFPFIYWLLYEPDVSRSGAMADNAVGANSVLPLRLLLFIYPISALSQIVFYFVPVQLPFHLQNILDASASQTGIAIASTAFFYALASLAFGWFGQQFRNISLLMLGFTLTGIGFCLIGLASTWIVIIFGLILGGFGLGLVIPNLNLWLANAAPTSIRGRLLGGFTTSLFLGQFISPFLSQPVANRFGIGGAYLTMSSALIVIVLLLFVFRQRIDLLGKS